MMSAKTARKFKNVDELTAHLEKLVSPGWASVIHCKAERFGGPRV
jgi:hypothetical protein